MFGGALWSISGRSNAMDWLQRVYILLIRKWACCSRWRIWTCPVEVVEVKVKGAQSCLTLCDPMDYTVHGILQAGVLEWVAFPFSRGSSQPRDWTEVSRIAGRFFTSWLWGLGDISPLPFFRFFWSGLIIKMKHERLIWGKKNNFLHKHRTSKEMEHLLSNDQSRLFVHHFLTKKQFLVRITQNKGACAWGSRLMEK